MKKKPKTSPSTGETTMKTKVLEMPLHSKALSPALERPAPTRPPTSACDELEGKPKCQVMRFQMMAPASAAAILILASSGIQGCQLTPTWLRWVSP